MDGELLYKIIQRIEGVTGIKELLILTVAALDFAVVPWRIRADQLVPDAQFGGCLFKQRLQIALAVGKAIGELKTIIRLDAFHPDAAACVPCRQLAKKIR